MFVLCAYVKAERDGGDASPGPLRDHFTQFTSSVGPVSHCSVLLQFTVFPWEPQRAKWPLCKQLGDGLGLSLIPEPGLSPLCFMGLRGPDFLARLDHIILGGREYLSVFRAAWRVLGGVENVCSKREPDP